MPTMFPCPVCHTSLTLLSLPDGLTCPFCRIALRFGTGTMPVGQQVRCGRCHGVFTADAPPPSICMTDLCPHCHVALKLPTRIGPNQKIKCPKCQHKYLPSLTLPDPWAAPRRQEPAPSSPSAAVGPQPSAWSPAKSAPKTLLAVKKASGRSKTQLAPPAALPESGPTAAAPESVPPAGLSAPAAISAESGRKTHVTVNKEASKSKTQLAPPAALPTPAPPAPAEATPAVEIQPPARDVDDEDVLLDAPAATSSLVGPAAADEVAVPDTQKVAAPPPRPAPRPPLVKPSMRKDPAAPRKPPPQSERTAADAPVAVAPITKPAPVRPRPQVVPSPSAALSATAETEAAVAMATAPARPMSTTMPTPRTAPPTTRESAVDWRKPLLITVLIGAVAGTAYLAYSLIPWGSGRQTVYPTEGIA